MRTIRVIVVDDNPDIHDAISLLLKQANDIELVGQTHDGSAALKLCQIARPDLILMDVIMPGLTGAETTRALLEQHPALKILVLSSYHEHAYITDMLNSGAIGYLAKDALGDDLVDTIRNAFQGNIVLSPKVAQVLLSTSTATPADTFALTERELQVLRHMGDGMTYNGIAAALQITPPTVRFHINNILEKMKVETRSEVLVLAAKHNLI